MEEPTTYYGASSGHVHCENYNFQPNVPLKIFKRNEVFNDVTWLDITNCTGTLDQNTFKNLPNVRHLNISSSDLEKIEPRTFSSLRNLTSVGIWKSKIPFAENLFENCDNLEHLSFTKLKNGITVRIFQNVKNLNYIMFDRVPELNLGEDFFLGLSNLKYLFVKNCAIENFSEKVFEPLGNLEAMYFKGNSLKHFSSSAFLKLTNLKTFELRDNSTNSSEKLDINYQIFESLPLLESISFPEKYLSELNLNNFKSLKTVQLLEGKASEDIQQKLASKNISIEWLPDIPDSNQEVDLSDPNIQICA